MKSMTPEELIEMCDRQIARGYTEVVLIMPGKWGETPRLYPGGPAGRIEDEWDDQRVIAKFDAAEIKQYLIKRIERLKQKGETR